MPGPFNAQAAGTGALANVYTSPPTHPDGTAAAGTLLATIALVNPTTTSAAVTVAVARGGAAAAAVHTLLPAVTVAPGDTVFVTTPIGLAPGDVVRANAPAGVNVHLYGSEL